MKTNKTLKRSLTLVLAFALVLITVIPTEAASKKSNKPAKEKITSAVQNEAENQINIKFKKVKNATGYQIAYKTTDAKKYTVKNTKKTCFAIKAGLNKTYMIKVRAYARKNSKTYYGAWSKTKTITNTCRHDWKTVIDKPAYDEPVYEWQWYTTWPDGTPAVGANGYGMNCSENAWWCYEHCITCYPDCPDPDPHGWCALYDKLRAWREVQVGTEHHDAVTHEECKKCHAVK